MACSPMEDEYCKLGHLVSFIEFIIEVKDLNCINVALKAIIRVNLLIILFIQVLKV